MKALLWTRDNLVILVLLALILLAVSGGWLEATGLSVYDRLRSLSAPVVTDVVVIAIDEHSVSRLGGFPFSSDTHQRVLQNLVAAGVTQVGYIAINADDDPSLSYAKIRAGVLSVSGVPFVLAGNDMPGPAIELPAYLRQHSLLAEQAPRLTQVRPVPLLRERTDGPTSGFGFVLMNPAVGEVVRSMPLLARYGDHVLPSMALQLFLAAIGAEVADVEARATGGLVVNGTTLPTDSRFRAWPLLHASGVEQGIAGGQVVSFHDVMHGAVSSEILNGKIALIGVTAAGLVPASKLPATQQVAPVMLEALTLTSMLGNKLVDIPMWGKVAGSVFVLLVALLLIWLRRKSMLTAVLLACSVLLVLAVIESLLLMSAQVYIDLLPSAVMLVSGFILIALPGLYGQKKEKTSAMSAEVHRRLGLASQKRGDLDAAFEGFRKCPLDNSIMVLLYYLAQEYENDGRFDRAVAVYQYMESFDPDYKDIQARIEKARMLEETVLLDNTEIKTASSSEDADTEAAAVDENQKMLGRYVIEKQIGKGAMGLVYQGSDPKINRVVAIKTLNLKQEFEEDEQANVLGRFFHEAEAAGRLHHPNIVTIYDAGEEADLAYIAMEYLTGSDLRVFARPDRLLPPLTVIKMGMKLADALDYAHKRDIIHRDIKAANVMYDPSTGQLKVTDFGIARLTDSRRTKTGMVLGTPSSMSPEQLRGHKLDGRTDLYSLGILMFQMLTGRLPYKAESLTKLMYKITKEEPPDLLALRPDLKENGRCIRDIIHKLLEKKAEDRYQSGKHLARDLLGCAKKMAGRK